MTAGSRVGALLREPVVRFLALGALLFAFFGDRGGPRGREIVVDGGVRRSLARDHERRTGHAPTAAEEEALVRRWADEEMLYREALALGLDRGDVIVRRRLLQKMDLLAEGAAPTAEPDDAELARYLASHPERWWRAPRLRFEHVFVAAERHRGDAATVAGAILARLDGGEDPATLGDPFPRGRSVGPATAAEIDSAFGPGFAAQVEPLADGRWGGPLRSSYGLHLVRPGGREPGGAPPLAEVRDAVRHDWLEERRAAAREAALADLRRRWPIRREP